MTWTALCSGGPLDGRVVPLTDADLDGHGQYVHWPSAFTSGGDPNMLTRSSRSRTATRYARQASPNGDVDFLLVKVA